MDLAYPEASCDRKHIRKDRLLSCPQRQGADQERDLHWQASSADAHVVPSVFVSNEPGMRTRHVPLHLEPDIRPAML
jgi:hypothetical protein